MSERCICGHEDNMHYAPSGRCMKVITKHYSGNVDCTCLKFRRESSSEKASVKNIGAEGKQSR